MTWTRLDDGFTDRPVLDGLPYDVRWHYLSLIGLCSRTGRFDGYVPASAARRCSDVPDPAAALAALVAVGLLAVESDGYRVPLIDEHVPPPSVRENSVKAKVRMARHRAHKAGDHSGCLPSSCPEASTVDVVTGVVTRNTGTGQDGTGQAGEVEPTNTSPWPPVRQPGSSSERATA